jgi:hypothetical protein
MQKNNVFSAFEAIKKSKFVIIFIWRPLATSSQAMIKKEFKPCKKANRKKKVAN